MKGKLFFDGSNDPKGIKRASAGYVLYVSADPITGTMLVPEHLLQSNNSAEYTGLIEGMKKALELGVTDLEVIGDSQLVIYQVLGKYKCKQPHLKGLLVDSHQIARKFDKITFEWKRRVHNEADAVSRMG